MECISNIKGLWACWSINLCQTSTHIYSINYYLHPLCLILFQFVLHLPHIWNFVCFLLQVDILDTSGDMQFPAMRRLSIATAHAFMLVYATTSAPSFQCVKQCFEEIREQRADFQVSSLCILNAISTAGASWMKKIWEKFHIRHVNQFQCPKAIKN